MFPGSLDGKPATRVLQTDNQVKYDASTGRLLYMQANGTLSARKVELHPPRLTGDPAVVAESVAFKGATRQVAVSVSGSGTLLYGRENPPGKARFVWRDRSGKLLVAIGPSLGNAREFRVSPDGGRLAYEVGVSPAVAIWVYAKALGVPIQMTFRGDTRRADWLAGGKYFYYYRNSRGPHRRAAERSGEEEVVIKIRGRRRGLCARRGGRSGGL